MNKNRQFLTNKMHIGSHHKLLFLFAILTITIFLAPMVSSWEWDNAKGDLIIDESTSKYGKIEIRNTFLGIPFFELDRVAELELLENSELCIINCEALKEITLDKDGVLVSDIRFETLNGYETSIQSYDFYILNGNKETKYKLGSEVSAGTYLVKLKGKKGMNQDVDWIIKSNGVWIDDWAVWSGSLSFRLLLYYNFTDERESVEWAGNTSYNLTAKDHTGVAVTYETTAGLIGGYANSSCSGDCRFNDGLNISVATGGFTGYKAPNRSISFWLKMHGDNNGKIGHVIGSADGDLNGVSNADVDITGWGNTTIITPETWTFLTLTQNDTTSTYYLNGIVSAITHGVGSYSNNILYLGVQHDGIDSALWGWGMDELGIWNRTLTASEVSDLYNSGSGLTYDGSEGTGPATTTVDITLVEPADSSSSILSTMSFNATFDIGGGAGGDGGNFTNTTLRVFNSTFDLFTNFTTITGNNNQSNLSISNLNIGTYNWNYEVCLINATQEHQCNLGGSNFTWIRNAINEDAQSFSIYTQETQSEFFQENISAVAGIQVLSSNLNYNGTVYSANVTTISATQYALDTVIDINLLEDNSGQPQNKTWFFDFTYLEEGTSKVSANTTTRSHIVNATEFTQCDATYKTGAVDVTLNFEENQSRTDGNFEAAFNFWLGDGNIKKSNSTDLSSGEIFNYCILPNATYKVDASIDISKLNFEDRHYDFRNKEFNADNITLANLFFVNTSASNVIVEVKDQGLIPLEGILVEIDRFYPRDNNYTLVESQLTDDYGQFVAKLIENDVKYRFKFFNQENTLIKITQDISIACKSSICILPFIIEEEATDFQEFQNLTTYTSLLSFDNETNIFTFTWDDNRGESSSHRLLVQRILINGTIDVCDTTQAVQDGIMTCAVGSSKSSYRASAFRILNGKERRIAILNIKVGEIYGMFGVEGLFWVFLLLMTCIGIFSFAPQLASVVYMVIFTAFGILGIISATIPVYIATYVICIIFIWAFRS